MRRILMARAGRKAEGMIRSGPEKKRIESSQEWVLPREKNDREIKNAATLMGKEVLRLEQKFDLDRYVSGDGLASPRSWLV
jgi:hypothetical protein